MFFIFCGSKPDIDFYREKIIIEIDAFSAFVTGDHFLKIIPIPEK